MTLRAGRLLLNAEQFGEAAFGTAALLGALAAALVPTAVAGAHEDVRKVQPALAEEAREVNRVVAEELR